MSPTGRASGRDLRERFHEYLQLDERRGSRAFGVDELERWRELKRALNAHFEPGVRLDHADRRGSVRVRIRLQVDFESYGATCEGLVTNLSRAGLFIATDTPLPMGTPLRVRLGIEETGQRLDLSGEVVSQNIGPGLRSEDAGMGVRFSKLSEADREAIGKLYRHAFARALNQSGS